MTSLTQVAALHLRRAHARTLWAPSGVPVSVAPSWPLGIALTAWTVGDALLPDAVPGRSTAAYTIAAIATAAALAFPHTPPRSSPPGTAVTLLGHTHGPEMAAQNPPHASRPGTAGALLGHAVRAR